MEQDVVRLKMSEMLVGRMNLKYHDKKTGDIRDEGATRPEVIMRQLCTKPGQARLLSHHVCFSNQHTLILLCFTTQAAALCCFLIQSHLLPLH